MNTNQNVDRLTLPNVKRQITKATPIGSIALILGLFMASNSFSIDMSPSAMAQRVAIVVGISLIISFLCDFKAGWKNLFRVDILCLCSLYFLTLIEFLYPQLGFDQLLNPLQTQSALQILLIGFGGLTIGRHINVFKSKPPKWLNLNDVPNKSLFQLFIISAFLAYFYMLFSVNFNPLKLVEALLGPRFSVPWGRASLGDWRIIFSEWKLFAYVIPPLTGIIWNYRKSFSGWQIQIVIFVFIFTIFEGFSGGTRNVFATYLATFLGGYLLTLERPKFFNVIVPITITGFMMMFATQHMLGFRQIGIINYLATSAYSAQTAQESFSVDYNLYSMGMLIDAFPRKHDFLGLEVIFVFFTKPIPRFLWPDKPLGLSVSIEEVIGADGWTVSATYIGECYMMGGIFAVIVASLLLGMLANWWSRTADFNSSGYGVLINALGFFTSAITMRSLIGFTTSILPIIGVVFLAKKIPSLLGISDSKSNQNP